MQPTLSVLIPTYNRADLLPHCLQSLRSVSVDCEILVVDNASTDATPQVLSDASDADSRIVVVRNETNIGPVPNYNRAMQLARGKYLCLFGDDDASMPGNFEPKLRLLEEHPEIGFVWGGFYRMDSQGHIEGHVTWPGILPHGYLGGRDEFRDLLTACYIPMQSVVFRRTLFEQFGGLDEGADLAVGCDWDMLLRWCRETQTAFLPEPAVCVRHHEASYSRSVARKTGSFARGRVALWRKWLVEHPHAPVLDDRHWAALSTAFEADLRWEFPGDEAAVNDFLNRLQAVRREASSRHHNRVKAYQSSVNHPPDGDVGNSEGSAKPQIPTHWPEWLLKFVQRIHRGGPGNFVCIELPDASAAALMGEGWVSSRDLPADILIAMDTHNISGHVMAQNGLFVVRIDPGGDVEKQRTELQQALNSSVHLLDPEPDTHHMFGFGWSGSCVLEEKRVLFASHQRALRMMGGGETQMLETLCALRDHGIRADITLSLRLKPEAYSLVHLFSLFNADKTDPLRASGVPVVTSTIFWDYAEMRQAAAITGAIFSQPEPADIQKALDAWRAGGLHVEGLNPAEMQEPKALRDAQREVLRISRHLLPNGLREAEMLHRAFGEVSAPITVIPNAVRPDRFLHADPSLFRKAFGIEGDFVLCAARVEPNKNQIMLLHALRGTGIPLILVGPTPDQRYWELCRSSMDSDAHYVGELPPDLLASAYAAARVHALPSWSETPGLVNLEAGLAGCALVVGDRGTEKEYLGPHAVACSPGDWLAVRSAVVSAWQSVSEESCAARREHILRNFTWDRTAERTAEVYTKVLSSAPRWYAIAEGTPSGTLASLVEAYVTEARGHQDALLRLYSRDAEALAAQIETALRRLGVDVERCPDIEITDQPPMGGPEILMQMGAPGERDALARAGGYRVLSRAA
jgi:glycosyltransferase involved in cell wall biosynthesis